MQSQTRQKFKEAYDHYTAATIERAEKQLILAKQARRIVNLLDDTPVVPGDTHATFDKADEARQVLNDAEDELRSWQPNLVPIHTNASNLGTGAMPGAESVQSPTQFESTGNRTVSGSTRVDDSVSVAAQPSEVESERSTAVAV